MPPPRPPELKPYRVAVYAIYGGFFSVAGWLLSLPLTIYQSYFRERAYGMATQTFGPWFGEPEPNVDGRSARVAHACA